VQLDVTRYTPDQLESRVQMLRQSSVRIAADKLDTYDDVEFSKSLGADFYRGRFLWKPAVKQDEVPANRLTMVRALSKLQDPDMSMDELEEVISQDVALSYKVLRYVNSAAVALASDVTSIGHAVRLVGVRRLKSWASVLLLSSVEDKPLELMRTSLIRGRMCELLATSLRHSEADSFFTAGLLSALDALLDCPMKQAVKDLPLSRDIEMGILEGSGAIGQALHCTLAYEWGAWDDVRAYGASEGISVDRMRDCYMDAIHWSDGVLDEVST
jgi:EAL and modified HD-GYP domain-containing signal transduction protein